MKSVSKLRLLVFCLLLISPFIISAEDNVSYWLNTQVEVGIIDRLKFKGEQALWYDDDRFTLTETLLLMEADVFDWLSIGVGDRLADERKRKDDKMQWVHEHRPTLDITFKHSYEGFKFDFRNRFEYRDKEGDKKSHLRYRGRVRIRTPWQWTEWKISPYASWEAYIEDDPDLAKGEMFNKSRSIIGLSMKPMKHTTISLFYLLLHERDGSAGWNPIHVPGIDFKLDF